MSTIVTCPKCKHQRTYEWPEVECPQCGTSIDDGIVCELCGGFVPCGRYGDGNCDDCFQRYEYDESQRIILGEDQIELLKQWIAGVRLDETQP